MWARFVGALEDAKLTKDIDKFLQKQKTFEPAWMIEGYIALYKGDDIAARQKFTQAVTLNPNNRIALYYLAELAYTHGEYARATTLYTQLLAIDRSHPEIETKRQKAFLLATDDLLRAAVRAESENRLPEAENYYREALRLAPSEPALHARLADLLFKQNKKEDAEAHRKTAEDLTPRRPVKARAKEDVKSDSLEDIGRWGGDIGVFHQIRNAEMVTREQFAILLVRYFPQLPEFRQNPQIVTDVQDSPGRAEIQAVVDAGIVDPFPNHDFEPASPLTRGDLAKALGHLSRLLGMSANPTSPITPTDVAPTNALYPDIQLVLGYELIVLTGSGSFDVEGHVSGPLAVTSVEKLLRSFQQVQR
jgi:tetratricopeptide (TPR) repeat protein